VEFAYPNGTTSVAEYRTSLERFVCVSQDIARQWAVMRVP
jgi:hypothetical protein